MKVTPIPSELWSNIPMAKIHRLPGERGFYVEITPSSQVHILTALSCSIEQEMRRAGEWAARPRTVTVRQGLVSSRAMSRHFADRAAFLLSIYAALYAAIQGTKGSNSAPEIMKVLAKDSYESGFRDERRNAESYAAFYNENLYDHVPEQAQT